MKIIAAICVLAVGVSAQVGQSGIVRPTGDNTQFTREFADDIVLAGPSGVVTRSGKNLQLTSDLYFVPRAKRSTSLISEKGNIGTSGILRADGTTDLFSYDLAHDILLVGPAGIVTKSGRNLQLTEDLRLVNPRVRRSTSLISEKGNIGTAGILRADGSTQLFSHDLAHDILLIGPGGIVTKSGRNLQLTDDLTFVPRAKRSTSLISEKGNIGTSGILRADGTTDLFGHDLAHDILLIGPAGIVTKSGRNLQLTEDLRLVNPRFRRSLTGPSGMITDSGHQIQFKEPFATILLEGPSGYIMSDGTLVQKRAKRHLVGESGIITNAGRQIQLERGVFVVHAGPSGIVLSNGKNIQLNE
ncbi:uncharacterized protein [Panulirus ornatus]|uniref:uncharacterized protein n=1 Tax=Panulirus ornatus TaxID=150431 RepID=UPI003A8AC431